MSGWIKKKVLYQLGRELEPGWSIKVLKGFEKYFFILFLGSFGWLVLIEPIIVGRWTVNTFIGFATCLACWGMCRYMRWWIDRREQGYQPPMKGWG